MVFQNKKKRSEMLLQSFGLFKEDSFDFDLIAKYFNKKKHDRKDQVLSDKTCNDLDFNELFTFIDRTHSKIGQQFLYNKFRVLPSEQNFAVCYEDLIERFRQDVDYRLATQLTLEKLKQDEAAYVTTLFQDDHIKPPKWFFLVRLLSLTSILSLLFFTINPSLIFVLLGVFIINIGIHYWNKKNLFQYVVSMPQLLNLNKVAKTLFVDEKLQRINPKLDQSIKTIDKVKNKMTFFKLESKLEGDMETIFWAMLELVKILFMLEPILLFSVLKKLEDKRHEIEEVFEFVGTVDALLSIASLREGLDSYCYPTPAGNLATIYAKEVYHPLIVDCVKNSIHVNDKSILLTGSNMSGKTSFIRTIGINAISGLTLNTCFASEFTLPNLKIHSAIRISDDLMNDKSYYFEEVLTIKGMIDASSEEGVHLFLLDELFKGTNTVERIAAGKAVLSELAKKNNLVFVSTHDIEMTDLLKDEYELYHFSEKVDHKTVDFDYLLKPGKLKKRNAIRILQINDYPTSIIDEAIKITESMSDPFKEQ